MNSLAGIQSVEARINNERCVKQFSRQDFSFYLHLLIAGYKVCLSDFHSGKFEDKTLDSFAGAVIGDNENDLGTDLQDYCHSMLEEKEAVPK